MKVLFIQPYLSFLGVISDTLPGHLARRGHEVEVVSYVRDKEKIRLFSKGEQIPFHFVDAFSISIPNFVTEFPYFFSLERIIKEIQPDIIHINNLPFLTTFQSVKIAKKMRKKSAVHVHGVMGARGFLFNLAQEAYIFTFGYSIFHNTDKVICLTINDAEKIRRYGCPPEKIYIVPNGVDVNKFHPLGDEVPDLLLWCGRFVPQKGLVYLIEALRIIVEKRGHPEVKLAMTGDGPLLPKIHEMVRKHKITKNVIFMGYVPRKEMPSIMNKASIYVLPSLNEGMPYALLEAMACGKPVVGSDIPGINDVVKHGENGFLVPSKNPEALADNVLALLNDEKLRKQFGEDARKVMVDNYDWNVILSKIERVYNETNETIHKNWF